MKPCWSIPTKQSGSSRWTSKIINRWFKLPYMKVMRKCDLFDRQLLNRGSTEHWMKSLDITVEPTWTVNAPNHLLMCHTPFPQTTSRVIYERGRPITSSMDWGTRGIQKFLADHLQPLVRLHVRAHLKSTLDFVDQLMKFSVIETSSLDTYLSSPTCALTFEAVFQLPSKAIKMTQSFPN